MLKEKSQERKRTVTAQAAQIYLQTGFEDSVVWQKPLPLFSSLLYSFVPPLENLKSLFCILCL